MLVVILWTAIGGAMAQQRLSGTLIDRDTKEGVMMVTVQMLRTDSSFVKGALSDEQGHFTLQADAPGTYLLRFTSVGYKTLVKRVKVADQDVDLGRLTMGADAIMLKGATVTGHAAKVTVSEDTIVYNAAAYHTPEGSVVEELVKRLPGAQVSDDGTVTVNGKTVKKILVDGKEFMEGDTKTALKNLPTAIIEKIKTYDEKSDLAKVTGIDDGEEQTVLDFGVKRGMNKGVFANADASVGTHDRYSERLMGALFQDATKVMFFAGANNTGDRGFPGGGGRGSFGGGQQGLNASKMLGVNVNHEIGDKFKLNGHVRWNHSDGDTRTEQSTENFVSSQSSFSNSLSQRFSRSNTWSARFRLEWKPDTMTNILFRPRFSMTRSDGLTNTSSATFNADPYLSVDDPLSDEAIDRLTEAGVLVNTREQQNVSYSDNKTVGGMLQLNRKLNNSGRNVTLRGEISYSDKESKGLNHSDIATPQTGGSQLTQRYTFTPAEKFNYNLQATYTEPIFRGVYLQFAYKYTYQYNKSDRRTYDLSEAFSRLLDEVQYGFRPWSALLAALDQPLENYRDDDLTRFSTYRNYIHDLQTTLRISRKKYNLNAGVMVQPQQTRFHQDYGQVDMTRNVVNIAPTLDFRYKFNKLSQLRATYRGTTTQPDMSDLLDITDNSDPLNVTCGNPGLKPSFTNNFHFFYNGYVQSHQQAFMFSAGYSNTRNSVSQKVSYDETTGGRITRPENINGNWNIDANAMYNVAVDSAGVFSISTFTNARYNNYVGFLASESDITAPSVKNTTRTTQIGEQLNFTVRHSWLEATLDGTVDYTHTRNLLQSNNNLNTWQFSYGGSLTLTMPWGTSLSTDLHNNCRRGYNDQSMNTNELIWNAQLSQSFLRGNALTVSLQFYDILKKQSTFSRTINAMMRSDSRYNSITNYAMLHVIYRINLFGGKMPTPPHPVDGMPRGTRSGVNRLGGGMPPAGHPGGMPPGHF